jgi:hypothetical protein
MRTKRLAWSIALYAVSLMLSGCSNGEYKQTFVTRFSDQELQLTSKVGIVRPGGFPQSVFVSLPGQPDLKGTYVLKTEKGSSKGTFVTGKDTGGQWVNFTPTNNDERTKWTLRRNSAGYLEGDNVVWEVKSASADISYLAVEEK